MIALDLIGTIQYVLEQHGKERMAAFCSHSMRTSFDIALIARSLGYRRVVIASYGVCVDRHSKVAA